jgi:ketosteroid isomerase-like protein
MMITQILKAFFVAVPNSLQRSAGRRFAAIGWAMIAFLLCGSSNFDAAWSQPTSDEKKIIDTLAQISSQFSAAYVKGDIEKLVSFYTDDAVIFPGNSDLIRGKEAIKKYWTLAPGRTVTHHKITAVEIKIMGDFAYDYGYYEVSGRNNDEAWGPNYGKYLIVWKRGSDGAWKMHLDMWNSRPKPE